MNLATELQEAGVLDLWEVEMIGADVEAIRRAEDRLAFRSAMQEIGLRVPRSAIAHTIAEAEAAPRAELGLPLVVRPAYTLGGSGGGIAHDRDGLRHIVANGLRLSPITQVMLEESVAGWHEFELEVMRDRADNVVVICSIENIDPMGVHTGDSVTVAPALTLTDPQYQELRDAAKAIIRKIGVDTGGSNVQFAVQPETGEVVVIEMNPRVSRSSALASKATGFPIAKIAAKLAVGYTLDEIPNDITKKTPASFEPTLDYVVVKMPRWAFEKFPMADRELTTHMKSVGEAMAIGRTFKEAFLKAMRSRELETPRDLPSTRADILKALAVPTCERYELVLQAFRHGVEIGEVHEATGVSPFFLAELRDIVELEREVRESGALGADLLRRMKRYGFSDRRLGELTGRGEREVRALRLEHDVTPVYKAVDTCAAEFEAETPYFYSTYEDENEALPGERERVVILGSGPNRIGQGIEFDYCCVHAAMTAREMGYEAVMVNCNPETVSTDYDTSDRLYVEPLTFEDVINVVANERPEGGHRAVRRPDAAEDRRRARRGRRADPRHAAGVDRPRRGPRPLRRAPARARHQLPGVRRRDDRRARRRRWRTRSAFPCSCARPTCSAGAPWRSSTAHDELERYMERAARVSPDHPVLIDRFLEDAIEVDVDALCDGEDVYVGAVMQHVEEAGVHSGDSACVIPSLSLGEGTLEQVRRQTRQLALALGVKGLMNVQFAYQNYRLYVLEVNPRASRTVPFVSKATGVQLAKLATRVILGERLRDFDLPERLVPEYVSVKEAVLPFDRFPGTRHAPRARDEVDRRGDGHRRRLPDGVRQGAGGGAGAAAARGQRLPLGLRQRQVGGDDPRPAPAHARASRSSPRAARRRPCRASASRCGS